MFMFEGVDVFFVFKWIKFYQLLKGVRVNLIYYFVMEIVVGMEFE